MLVASEIVWLLVVMVAFTMSVTLPMALSQPDLSLIRYSVLEL